MSHLDFPQSPQVPSFMPAGDGAMEGDNRLHVTFIKRAVLNKIKSAEANRPIHEPVDFIRIQQPGERDCIDRPATPQDKHRFRRQWESFQTNAGDGAVGTMLNQVFPNNPEIVENLKYLKIFTAEQMAALNDTGLQNVGMGARQIQQRCIDYLATAEKGGNFNSLSARLDAMELQQQAKDKRIADLEAALAEAERATEKPRRGRPPNNPAAQVA